VPTYLATTLFMQPVIKVPRVLSVHNAANETPINQSPLLRNHSYLLVILMRVFILSLPLSDATQFLTQLISLALFWKKGAEKD